MLKGGLKEIKENEYIWAVKTNVYSVSASDKLKLAECSKTVASSSPIPAII